MMSDQESWNTTSLPLQASDPFSLESVVESVALVIICVSSMIGNGCVIAAVARSERLRERPGSYIVGSLAITDGVFMPVAMTFNLVFLNSSSVVDLKSACDFFSNYLIILIYIVVFHLCLMSWDRFIAVVYPLRGQIILTRRKVLYLLIPAWFLPVFSIGMVPQLLNTQDEGRTFRGKILGCITTNSDVNPTMAAALASSKAHQLHLLSNTLIFVVGPFVTMLLLYGKLSLISLKQENKVGVNVASNLTPNERRVKTKKIKEMKWAKTVGIVIGAFALTYIPSFTCTLVEVKYGPGAIPQKVFSFFAVVVFLNSAINALVYSFRSVEYRREFKRITRDLVRTFLPGFSTVEGNHLHVGEAQFIGSSTYGLEARTQANDTSNQ